MKEVMTGKEAIMHILEYTGVKNKAELASSLSGDLVNVEPIQITHYLNGSKMSVKVAKRFENVYGIIIAPESLLGSHWDK